MTDVVIGVDPGDSTGVAILKDDKLWHVFQGAPPDALTLIELTVSHSYPTDDHIAIACERYISMQTRGRSHQPTAQRVGGAVQHLAEHHGGCKFTWQGPADAWAIASNDMLKKLGWYQTSKTVGQIDAADANMAIRHALLYMARAHATRFEALLRGCGWLAT